MGDHETSFSEAEREHLLLEIDSLHSEASEREDALANAEYVAETAQQLVGELQSKPDAACRQIAAMEYEFHSAREEINRLEDELNQAGYSRGRRW